MTVPRSSIFSPSRGLFAPAQHALIIGVTISLLLHAGVLFWHASSATQAHQSPTLQAESHLPGQDDREQESVIANAQIAAMTEQIQNYNAQPRKQFVEPSAQASRYAAYLDAWRTRIENIGTQHYPEGARGRIYGSLRITVTVRSDGSLVDMVIEKPSEHAVLNQAARRILQLASPFPPFPAALARETDMLVITRSWNFVNDTLQTQTL